MYFREITVLSIPLGLDPPPSREKNWREELCLGLVQNESKAHRLISIRTKPRKSFSRQILSLDKPSGIQYSKCSKKKGLKNQPPSSITGQKTEPALRCKVFSAQNHPVCLGLRRPRSWVRSGGGGAAAGVCRGWIRAWRRLAPERKSITSQATRDRVHQLFITMHTKFWQQRHSTS